MDPDKDMIADVNVDEKQKENEPVPKCICGSALSLKEAQQCYDDCKSIECDLCETEYSGSEKVYHCNNKSDKHEEGYDICTSCAIPSSHAHKSIDNFYDHIFATLYETKPNSDLILSPLSILIAMTICMCGANNNTLKEMIHILHPKKRSKEATFDTASAITKKMLKLCDYFNKEYGSANGDKPMVKIANKIWINTEYKILDSYISAIRKKNVDSIDISNTKQAAKLVNKWCAKNTNNMIKKVVTPKIMEGTILLIANAIYFKGKFVKKFPKKQTKKNQKFYSNKNRDKTMTNVSMMFANHTQQFVLGYRSTNADKGTFDVVKLRYKNSKLSLILAINNYSIRQKQLLTVNDLKRIDFSSGKLDLYVPKFKFEFEMVLNDVLKQMGIKEAFHEVNADFSHMSGNKELVIGAVIHKAVIEVDEEGTEAAAVTVVKMKRKKCAMKTKKPPTLHYDHPFAFYIFDGENKIVLFSGTYAGA